MDIGLDKDIEAAIISIVSRKIAPAIAMKVEMPKEVVALSIKKLVKNGRIKIGYWLEGDLVRAHVFVALSKTSNRGFVCVETGVIISQDCPPVFQLNEYP